MFQVIASEAAEGNGFWLPHDINEVIWGTIAFLLVVGVLYTKAGPFIKNGFKSRTERIDNELASAARTRGEAEQSADEIKSKLADSDAEGARIKAEGVELAQKVAADIAKRTHSDVAAVKARCEAEIAQAQRALASEIETELRRVSVGAAERVVDANLNAETHQSLIDSVISQVAASN